MRMREDFLTAGKGDPCSLQHEYLALLEDESLADVDLVLGPNRIMCVAVVLCGIGGGGSSTQQSKNHCKKPGK